MKRILVIAGGLALIAAMFLPFQKDIIFHEGHDIFEGDDEYIKYLWMAAGVVIAVFGLLSHRVFSMVALALGLGVLGMGVKYYLDTTTEIYNPAWGVWLMLAGGTATVIGAAIRLMGRPAAMDM